MYLKKIGKYVMILFGVLGIVGFFLLHQVAPYAIIQPPRLNAPTHPQHYGLKSNDFLLPIGADKHLKVCWVASNTRQAKGVIILVHGVGGCKEHFAGLAKMLADQGISTILFDGRAHGESDGEYCTYGFYEKQDIAKIVDKIKATDPNLPIGIWGNSLGGAIALQALELDERLAFGIIESTFADLSQIVFDYKKRMLKGFGVRFLSDYVLKRAGQIANFVPEQVKPIASVANIEQPVLIAHGDMDENIAVEYGQQLFDNLNSTDKELVIVEGGTHFDLFGSGGMELKNKVLRFIGRNLN